MNLTCFDSLWYYVGTQKDSPDCVLTERFSYCGRVLEGRRVLIFS